MALQTDLLERTARGVNFVFPNQAVDANAAVEWKVQRAHACRMGQPRKLQDQSVKCFFTKIYTKVWELF